MGGVKSRWDEMIGWREGEGSEGLRKEEMLGCLEEGGGDGRR